MAAIAQLVVPADGFGSPAFAVADWVHGRVFLVSNTALRVYLAALVTQTPIASVAAANDFATIAFSDADPITGSLVVANANNAVTKYDPISLAQTGRYVPGTIIEGAICVGCGTLASGGAVQRGYAVIKQSIFSGAVDVIFTDTMTTAGALLGVVSGSVNNRGTLWRGASGRAGASIFAIGNNYTAPQSSYPIWCVDIRPGAENYTSDNPHITVRTVGTVTAAAIDAAWATFTINSVGYDAADGNLLLDVSTTTGGVTHARYIAKISAASGTVIWATPTSDVATLRAGRINARLPMVRPGTFDAVNLSSGADTSTTYNGVTPSYVAGDSTSRLMLLDTSFVEGTGSPAPVSGTPSSFTGWAIADWPDRADPDFPLVGVSKVLLPSAELQFLDANGHPYAGGSLETLVPSTDTPKDTWSDPAGAALNDNPITLDSAGRCVVFGDGAYRTILKDAAGNLVWDKPSFTYVSAAMMPVVGAPTIAAAVVLLGIQDSIDTEAVARAAADTAEASARAAADTTLTAALDAEIVAREAADVSIYAAIAAAISGLPAPSAVDVLLRRGTTVSAGDGAVSITFSPAFPLYCMTFGLDLSTFDNTGGFQLVGETVTASTVTFTFTLGDGTTPRAAETFNYWATGY